MDDTPKGNGWNEWKNHVLIELKNNTGDHLAIDAKLSSIQVAIAELKVRAGIWGMVAGAIPVVIGLAILIIREGIK